MAQLLSNFLGTPRWRALYLALRERTSEQASPAFGFAPLLLALVIALFPVAITFLNDVRAEGAPSSMLPTITFGICALLAVLCRRNLGLSAPTRPSILFTSKTTEEETTTGEPRPAAKQLPWRKSLSLTHTAVAFGCIPAAVILLLSHTLLADRHDVITHAVGSGGGPKTVFSSLSRSALILGIAAWVAITEELIFRGLLVSVIRRCTIWSTQIKRDQAAVIISALVFGLAHWPTWGPLPALALVGLGVGFVLGYIANGERLGPVIFYHFCFDTLSLIVSLNS